MPRSFAIADGYIISVRQKWTARTRPHDPEALRATGEPRFQVAAE